MKIPKYLPSPYSWVYSKCSYNDISYILILVNVTPKGVIFLIPLLQQLSMVMDTFHCRGDWIKGYQ